MRNPPCILIADDNEMNLDILATRLATHGYEILKAMDGEVALALSRTQRPDLILLDVMMPKMDGLEVCRRIKQDPSLPFMPVIIVTAKTDSRDIISGLEAGGDEYLTKPVDQAALVARVQSMLKHKALYDKTEEQAKQLEVQAALLAEKNEELIIQLLQETKLAEIARLLGDIGHDIKNMMMPIITGVGILEDELSESLHKLQSTERQAIEASQTLSREVLDMVRNNAKRIQDRVKEIGDAVKGRSSPPNFSHCQINKVVANAVETLRFYAESNKVALHSNNLECLPSIQADEARLFNACYNLINNAIPETPAGGSVTVTGKYDPDLKTVTLSIADTGRGMPPEVRDSLFTNQVMSKKVGGTGLGTKIVKDAVDAHNGSIIVETSLNAGTTFHLTLPINQI